MTLYLQHDKRFADHNYSAEQLQGTIKTSGCGPTCAASVISSLTGIMVTPDEMADYSVLRGYRTCGTGTANALFPDIAKKYNLKCIETTFGAVAEKVIKRGGIAVCETEGRPKGIFSDTKHFFLLVGISESFEFWDVGFYEGKYQSEERAGFAKINKNGIVLVNRADAVPEIKRYFCYEKKEEINLFKDIKDGDCGSEQIEALQKAGIINCDPEGNFKPDEPITRRDSAIMIANALRYTGHLEACPKE